MAGAGVTAAVAAQGFRQAHDRSGYHGGNEGYRGEGRHGRWRRGPITKNDFDARTRSRFARMDANGDGAVDTEEAKGIIERRRERRGRRWHRRGDKFARRIVRRFDVDKDGKVTQDEFSSRIAELFARFDLDRDGRITDADLPPMLRGREFLKGESHVRRRHHRRRGRRFMRLLRKADANGDNMISLAEAQAAAAKRFARLDRNIDGVVDKSDRESLRSEIADYKLKRFMHRYGASSDGRLTREQFAKFRSERFARLDYNNDGELSRDEMPRRHWRKWKRWHDHHGGGHREWRRGGYERRGQGDGDADRPRNSDERRL